MKWTVPFPMLTPSQLIPLAKAADDAGFDCIAVPDSLFYPEQVSVKYPYSEDGERFWPPDAPFVDPFISIPAMAAVTKKISFYTNVLKLPLRNPLLVAKQVSSIAVLSENRFSLGVGLSWIPEEFLWLGTEKKTRGARTDEAIEIIKLICAGHGPEFTEYHGKHYNFDRLMVSPTPTKPVPILIGGHSEQAFERAARIGDGWISVQINELEVIEAIKQLRQRLKSHGRSDVPFEIKVISTDIFDIEGFKRLADHGVTDIQVLPWYLYGGDIESFEVRRDSLFRFYDEVISKFKFIA